MKGPQFSLGEWHSRAIGSCRNSGFALVVTISMMVLLVLIALAMLSLSTIELRASQNGRALGDAQANARVALMLAIGELQQHAGSDMRVTANADILDASYPSRSRSLAQLGRQ